MPNERSKMDPAIIAALIGLAGVVVTALLSSPLLLNLLQRTPAPSPTTLASASTAPTTEVATTLVPGVDFQNECIASRTWQLYPKSTLAPDTQGCWDLSSWGVSAQAKSLVLLLTSPPSDQTRALYTPVGKKTDVAFTFQVDTLLTAFDQPENIAVGIVPGDNPGPAQGVLLLFQVESSQSNAPTFLKIRNQGTESGIGNNTKYRSGEPHRFTFRLNDISLTILMDNAPLAGPFNIPSARSFWIGYTVPSGGNLAAVVSNLSVQSQ